VRIGASTEPQLTRFHLRNRTFKAVWRRRRKIRCAPSVLPASLCPSIPPTETIYQASMEKRKKQKEKKRRKDGEATRRRRKRRRKELGDRGRSRPRRERTRRKGRVRSRSGRQY